MELATSHQSPVITTANSYQQSTGNLMHAMVTILKSLAIGCTSLQFAHSFSTPSSSGLFHRRRDTVSKRVSHHRTALHATKNNSDRLQSLADAANKALTSHGSDIFRAQNAQVVVTANNNRLGLTCTNPSKASDPILSYPYYDTDGSGLALSSPLATKLVFKDYLPEGYDGWTGDVGLVAMLLLNEIARCDINSDKNTGINLPKRKDGIQTLMTAWISSLPSFDEMKDIHPLLWDEDDQEVMQSSSTKKIYRLLDDIEDDASWLTEKLWSNDRTTFPESVTIMAGGMEETRPCYSQDGFRYAVALVRSRSYFVDGALRLLPYLDYANHDDFDTVEITGGGVGGGGLVWESAKGAILKSGKSLEVGEEVKISYGPKGPADYLLDHGFVPEMCQSTSNTGGAITAELTFEVDDSDRFRDDKLDILEFETYDLAPMEPTQVFDVTGGPGSTGEPDPAMLQFLRLVKLGGKDAFLLESIFRKEVWEFMSIPVSEANERLATTAIIDACQNALSEMEEASKETTDNTNLSEKQKLCAMVRDSERQALERTMVYVKQESEALDLKEYYQERRLKSLGLDSEWSPESDDVGFGGNRVPGGADYDW